MNSNELFEDSAVAVLEQERGIEFALAEMESTLEHPRSQHSHVWDRLVEQAMNELMSGK